MEISIKYKKPATRIQLPATSKRADKILRRLTHQYPDAKCSLVYDNPEQLLVSTILSAQCTDKQVNKVAPLLFRKFPTVKALALAPVSEIKEIVKPTGFYNNKAKSIKSAMQAVMKKFNGKVPDNMDDLLSLSGVGRKTANVVLGDGFGIPGIVVDTHVSRICRRLGLTKNTDPVKIEQDLMKIIPKSKWVLLGHLMIAHGRAVCKARNPKCGDCFLNDICVKTGMLE